MTSLHAESTRLLLARGIVPRRPTALPGGSGLDRAYTLLNQTTALVLILLGLFVAWPLLRAVFWSFQNVSILNPDQAHTVGATNYSWMVSDPRFRQAFYNTAAFALMMTATIAMAHCQVPCGIYGDQTYANRCLSSGGNPGRGDRRKPSGRI